MLDALCSAAAQATAVNAVSKQQLALHATLPLNVQFPSSTALRVLACLAVLSTHDAHIPGPAPQAMLSRHCRRRRFRCAQIDPVQQGEYSSTPVLSSLDRRARRRSAAAATVTRTPSAPWASFTTRRRRGRPHARRASASPGTWTRPWAATRRRRTGCRRTSAVRALSIESCCAILLGVCNSGGGSNLMCTFGLQPHGLCSLS